MRKLLLLAITLLLMSAQVWAQRTVSGKVTSVDDPMGIPGVAVVVKGTTIGAITDFDGLYTINNVPADAKELSFSFVGLKTKTEPIIGSTVNIVMESAAIALDAVTITSYGVRRKADNVGAAAQVGEEVIKRQTESNVINSLQGSVAGLQISSSTGQPGSPTTARIRGRSSINSGNDPLYVIDGVAITTGGSGIVSDGYGEGVDPLSSINPEDIENISVLKDASATAIYGSRASNGVIVITTKKGTPGSVTFNANAKVGFSTPQIRKESFRMLNKDDYLGYVKEAFYNRLGAAARGVYNRYPDRYTDIMKVLYTLDVESEVDTDWWDEVTRNGLIQDYSISASGGTDKVSYYASLGYFSNVGTVIGSDFDRYTTRLNLDYNITKWLKFGVSLSGSYSEVNSVPNSLTFASPIWGAGELRPTDPVKDEDGEWNKPGWANGYNPVALYTDEFGDMAFKQQYKALFSPYLQVKFHDNVFFQTKFGLDYVNTKDKNVWSSTVNPQGESLGGLTQIQDQSQAMMNITNTLNWMPSIGKNNFNILLGQEAQRFNYIESFVSGFSYGSPAFTEIRSAAETKGDSYRSDAALSSYFANVEYDFADKYYLSGSVRADGSSRFGEENRWGVFYAVGAKYRISSESFMAGTQGWLNNLVIRASYGTSGNQNVNYYAAQGYYGSSRYAGVSTLVPGAMGNPNLKWETRRKAGIGLEFSLFNALTVEFDYYNDMTRDMIFGRPLSMATGFSSQLVNIGRMLNQGVELQLNALLINKKNFKWTAAFNITTNQNVIIELASDEPIIGGITKLEEGKTSSLFFMREYAGVDPATGRPRWYDEDGNYVYNYNEAVPREVGSYSPDFYGGLSTSFEFFNFDFSVQFNYSYGNKLFINDLRYLEGLGESNVSPSTNYTYDNAWRTPGDETDVPRLLMGGNNGSENWSSRQLVDASYFRIKSIVLGYTLPRKHANKIHLSNFRAYVSVDNLYTVTSKEFRGYDPEAGLGGTQAANYPIPVNYTLGINIGF